MQTYIGRYPVIHSASLIIPDKETARVEFQVGTWAIKVRFSFEEKHEGEEEGSITIKPVDGIAHITFFGWDNVLGTGLKQPVLLGEANTGQKVLFILTHHRVGELNKLDVSFLLDSEQ